MHRHWRGKNCLVGGQMAVSYNELKGCQALLKGIGIEQDSVTKLEGLALEFQASMTTA